MSESDGKGMTWCASFWGREPRRASWQHDTVGAKVVSHRHVCLHVWTGNVGTDGWLDVEGEFGVGSWQLAVGSWQLAVDKLVDI